MVNVGDTLAGKYRVEKILGIGGMGMVVAATHLELDQKVALKFMLPDALASEQAMARFLREAKSAVKLRSEHVCRVLDVGRLDTGAPYIVMELMEGSDFAQLLKRQGPLSVADTVDYVLQALEGIAEAHANGIVHRDLKPGNLFVATASDGSPLVKVLDFGISKSPIGGNAATKTGDMMGSPAYMAPEQMASPKNVDARADLWALGVILYQAVTNTLPFDADTLPALCVRVMHEPAPSIGDVRRDLPAAFAAIVMKCLEKQPSDRYADTAALATALAPFGSVAASAKAARISRVLRRTVVPEVAATIAPDAPSHPSVPGRISTLQASAAEVSSRPDAPKHARIALILGAAALVVVVAVATVAIVGGGGTTPVSQPVEKPVPVVVSPPVAPPPPANVAPPEPQIAVKKPAAKPIPTVRPRPIAKPVVKPAAIEEVKPPPAEVRPSDAKPPEVKPPEPTETKPKSKWDHMQHDEDKE